MSDSYKVKFKLNILFNIAEYQKEKVLQQQDYGIKIATAIGYFSLNSERFYTRGISAMKYLSMPDMESFPLDLNKASIKPVKHEDCDTFLDNMLLFIRDHKHTMLKRYSVDKFEVDADMITHCELLQVLLCTKYTNRNWRIFATKYRNTIYLHLEKESERSEGQRNCQIWEAKLKRFLYSDSSEKQQLESELKDEQLYCVFQRYIGQLSVIYESPMGAHYENLQNDRHFQETHSKFTECLVIPPGSPTHDNSGISESELALSLWSKCSLSNIRQIYVARPNTSGLVEAIEPKRLSKLIKKNLRNWLTDECNDFLIITLTKIRETMLLDNPKVVYQFNYDAISGDITYEVCNQINENTFISDWYITMLDK